MVTNLYSGTTNIVMRAAFGPFISWMVLILGLLLKQQDVAAIAGKEDDGSHSCLLPDNVTKWRDDPPVVTIEWAYGEVELCIVNLPLPLFVRYPV